MEVTADLKGLHGLDLHTAIAAVNMDVVEVPAFTAILAAMPLLGVAVV